MDGLIFDVFPQFSTAAAAYFLGLALAREVLIFSMLSILLMQLLGTLAQARRM